MSCPHRQATTVHRLRQAPMRSRSPDQCVRVGARARSTQRSQGAEAPVRISSQTESRAPTPHPGRPSPSSRCAADSSSLSDLRPRPLLAVESRGAFPYGFHRATKPAAALGGPAPPRAGFYPGWSWALSAAARNRRHGPRGAKSARVQSSRRSRVAVPKTSSTRQESVLERAGAARGPVLLETKLEPQPLRPGHVARTRLLERLEDRSHRKLTLIAASAGAGKTSPLAELLPPRLWAAWPRRSAA